MDATLILRQRSLGMTLEVTVNDTQLDIIVIENKKVLERARVTVAAEESTKIRNLFWDALNNQPTHRLMAVRDLVFEQEWRGRARSQTVLIQGYPLTAQDRKAYQFINHLLPRRYRMMVDAGPYGRSRAE